jgi:hypothetical protein
MKKTAIIFICVVVLIGGAGVCFAQGNGPLEEMIGYRVNVVLEHQPHLMGQQIYYDVTLVDVRDGYIVIIGRQNNIETVIPESRIVLVQSTGEVR